MLSRTSAEGQGPEEAERRIPEWLALADLVCAILAGALWFAVPQIGPWPLVLALAPWAIRLVLTGQVTRRTQFDLLLILFLVTAGVSVWASYERQVAWHRFWLIVGGVLFFYALVNAEPLGGLRVWLLAVFGAGVAIYFLATHDWENYGARIEALGRLGRILQAPLPALSVYRFHPNVAGGVMAMMVPFAGLVTLQAWGREGHASQSRDPARLLRFAAGLGLLAVTLFGLMMTGSRGAWMAMAGALCALGLWAASGWLGRWAGIRQAWVFAGLLALGLVTLLGVGFIWPGAGVTAVGMLLGGNILPGRLDLLRNTATLVRDYPFVGAGLGGFGMLYSTYALLIHVVYMAHSHTFFLDLAVEQGMLAVVILVGMWLVFGWSVWQEMSRSEAFRGSRTLGAAALSLLAILLHGLADNVLYSNAVLFLFMPLAFAGSLPQGLERRPRRRTFLAVIIGVTVLLVMAFVWRDHLLSRVASNLGVIHQSQVELGVYSWPEWPIQDEVRRQVNLEQPIAEFEQALALDPRNATANRRLGTIELSLGQYEAALGHLEAAYAAEPWSHTTRQLLGEAYLANGRLEEGRALWNGLSNAQQQLDHRAWWYQYIGETERAEAMRQAASGHQ